MSTVNERVRVTDEQLKNARVFHELVQVMVKGGRASVEELVARYVQAGLMEEGQTLEDHNPLDAIGGIRGVDKARDGSQDGTFTMSAAEFARLNKMYLILIEVVYEKLEQLSEEFENGGQLVELE